MDLWESLVQDYLTLDRRLLLSSQYLVGGSRWSACIDFLAVDFSKKVAWMVEVSVSGRAFPNKVKEFRKDYIPRIRDQILQAGVVSEYDTGWKIGIWLFPPSDDVEWSRKLLKDHDIDPGNVTALDDVSRNMISGRAWEERFDRMPELPLQSA